MYEEGDVVTQNSKEAVKWRMKSIESKDEEGVSTTIDILYSHVKKGDSESLSALRELAEKDYDEAQYHLGLIYQYGYGVNKDYNEAGKWYLKAFKLGNTDMLGQIDQLIGKGVPEVIEIVKYLAEDGNKHAQAMLGLAYANGNGIKQDYNEALKWLRKSVAQNYDTGQFLLGLMYYHGKGVKQDYVEATRLFSKAANTGLMAALQIMNNANVLYGKGIMYRDGIDVKQNTKLASQFFHQAAAGGNAEANFILGDMYEHGKEVKQNYTKAIEYYGNAIKKGHKQAVLHIQSLAERGNVYAMYNLGLVYSQASFYDSNEQIKWLNMAAEKGYEPAIKEIVTLAEYGDEDALSCLKVYAEKGNANAQFSLANIYYMYYNGYDYEEIDEFEEESPDIESNFSQEDIEAIKEKTLKEATTWFHKSANNNHTEAQYQLGLMYLKGEGVEKDKNEATKWLLKAANKGHKAARNQLAELGIYPEVKSESTFKSNGYIFGNNVNLRASPSTNARVLTKFNNGHLISIGQKSGDWYFIKTANGKEGWVFKQYIKFKR